ncbi:MAG: hypothetical protein KJ630_22840 [Proteobacteria bacterium]|nr:hypothetical protein [Pseudomonadota bacterium]
MTSNESNLIDYDAEKMLIAILSLGKGKYFDDPEGIRLDETVHLGLGMVLRAEDFVDQRNQELFSCIQNLEAKGMDSTTMAISMTIKTGHSVFKDAKEVLVYLAKIKILLATEIESGKYSEWKSFGDESIYDGILLRLVYEVKYQSYLKRIIEFAEKLVSVGGKGLPAEEVGLFASFANNEWDQIFQDKVS